MTPAASPPSAQRVWTSNICTPECLHLRRLSPIDRCIRCPLRLIRLAKLLGGMGSLASERAAHEVDALKCRVLELEDELRGRRSVGV